MSVPPEARGHRMLCLRPHGFQGRQVRRKQPACLMLGLEQMVSARFRNWEPGPGLATNLEEASFCFPQGECGKSGPSCASQSSFPCRALGLQGKAVFLCSLSGKQKGSCRQSHFAPGRSEPRTVRFAHGSDPLQARLAGGNLPSLSPALGPAVVSTQ